MTPLLAGHLISHVRRAWAGAELCRARTNDRVEAAPRVGVLDGIELADLRGQPSHDIDYYAWEAVRIVNIAEKVLSAGLGRTTVAAALTRLNEEAPLLEGFRHAVTHPEDNRSADDVMYAGAAVRLRPGGRADLVLDPRFQTHDLLGELVEAVEAALLPLSPDEGPPPRFR